MMLWPRERWYTTSTPIRPKTAPDAPTVSAVGSSSSTPKAPASSEKK